ncbi:LuxR C-terminal-related transcriptional regulator [Saccharopolyspora sp. NFXS83]|uniref:helix-turn-helix transcriptional regulator n=1 Tax=Saccharopolyspora sp. NFXS83 TaxID=2993560 RepID=UPI00224B979E|nr:LuxR family transcriptional regulator [Saccharopolyspora sp. NFXS83]MCX2731489.1 LuxR C-terminal-related transcriptional regulator [Saccharopolyspora sp. NFXS83]
MARERSTLSSRRDQLAEVDDACRSADGTLVLVRGGAGEGKTTLLESLAESWRSCDLHVCFIAVDPGGGTPQVIDALLDAARLQLEAGRHGVLLDALATASRLRTDLEKAPIRAALPLVHELARVFGGAASSGRSVIVLDDADRAGAETGSVLSLLAQRLRAVGCAVVVATRAESHPDSGHAQVAPFADKVVDLQPLDEQEIDALLKRWCSTHGRAKLDHTVPEALRTALGPLRGNPSTIVSTLDDLLARGRLVLIDQHFCLSPLDEAIPLPESHHLVRDIIADGDDTERLAVLLALQDEVSVDELPMLTAAAAINLDGAGRGLDSLVDEGILEIGEFGKLRFAVPALAATLRRRSGEERARALHTALARQMLAKLERNGKVDRPRLASHLVHIGQSLDGSSSAIGVLIEEADRMADADPECAAAWYKAALEQLSEDDDRWPPLLEELLRLRATLGQYDELTKDIGLLVPALIVGTNQNDQAKRLRRTLLVAVGLCWLTTLLQDEQSNPAQEPARLFKALSGSTAFDTELQEFAAAVRDGRFDEAAERFNSLFGHGDPAREAEPQDLPELPEVLMLLHAAGSDSDTFQRAWSLWLDRAQQPVDQAPDRLREAGAMTDHATALEIVLGDEYRLPSRGSVLYYQEILRAYREGEWDVALSAARRMEAELSPQRTPARFLARAIAAEICSCRGEHRRAEEWLQDTSQNIAGGHLISWVRLGVGYRAGAREEALSAARQEYEQHRDRISPAGMEHLLHRLFSLTLREGRTQEAADLLDELVELDRRLRSETSSAAVLMAQAELRGAAEPAERAMEIARRRQDVPQLAALHLLLAELSEEPKASLYEAHAMARRLNWTELRFGAQELMRERGIAPPRTRSKQQLISSTESRIVRLVSDGYTNRQIAMAIQVSEKTVESRLTRLFARTGCRSRVELATASLEGRLGE